MHLKLVKTLMRAAFALSLAVILTGCGPKGPTYDEAVQNYQTELETLNRLKAERDELAKRRRAEPDEQKKLAIQAAELRAHNEVGLQRRLMEAAKKVVDEFKKKERDT